MAYTTKGARPHPHDVPATVHPAQDRKLSEAERQHVRALVASLSAGISYALGIDDEAAIQQGVPPTIRYRAMTWATLHRAAMSAAHHFAMVKATDAEANTAAQDLGDEFRDLILKQLPNSRESVAEIEASAA